MFYYLIDLHYSQTTYYTRDLKSRFTTLQIYTILKQRFYLSNDGQRFTTLQIYTILKQVVTVRKLVLCFTTLQIYTILKRLLHLRRRRYSFTTLQIYTILKPASSLSAHTIVLLPYRFTLFSNYLSASSERAKFYYLIDLHYSQTGRKCW